MIEWLQLILAEVLPDKPWKPVSRPALAAWLLFYAGFLLYAFSAHGAFLFIDSANLVVHEGGHNLFGWFGPTFGLWGGTLLQWLVPFLLATYFYKERQTAGFAFCMFFFFENWLYTATYMADARDQALPLVTTGDPDFVEHDWYAILSSLGVLNHDTQIAMVVRILGWCGMIACVAWLAMRMRSTQGNEEGRNPVTFPKPAIPLIQRYPGKASPVTKSNETKTQPAPTPSEQEQSRSSISNQPSEI